MAHCVSQISDRIGAVKRRHSAARVLFAFAAAALFFVPAGRLLAHGYVVRAIPADRSTLQRPPTRLQYWFSEALEPRFSTLNLRDSSGDIIASGGVDAARPSLLALQVPPDLADGAYIVELRPAFASDGHVVAESRVFFVGEMGENGGIAGQAADYRAIPLEVFWRALMNVANMLFFGAALLYSLVLLPAWGSAQHGAGGLPARVMRVLRNILIAAVGLAFAANLIALLQQTMAFFNADAGQVLEQNLWQVVQIGSRFGDVWTLRMVLLIFSAVLLFVAEYYRALMPQLAAGIWRGLAWLGALFIGLTMITGHAAGSLLLPWVALAVNWLHALAVAFWLGGIFTLVLVLPAALRPYAGDARRQALLAVMTRFSRRVVPLVLIVILSGLYNALNWFVSPADLATGYGRSLGVKLLMVVLLLMVGARHYLALRPQLAERFAPFVRGAAEFRGGLRLEALLALLTLLAVAWLSASPIPEPQSLQSEVQIPQATQTVAGYTLTGAVIPGGPGINTYDIVVSRDDAPVSDVQVYVQQVSPARARRGQWLSAPLVEAGLFSVSGDEIDAAGTWWTLVDVVDDAGSTARAAYVWDISDSAAVLQSRPPQPLHGVVLALLAAAVLWLLRPAFSRALAGLQVSWSSALIALAVVIGSLAVMGFGAAFIGEEQRAYEQRLNPPPTRINAVVPDADSLERGAALYRAHCLLWQGHSADFRALRMQLDAVRDEFLYAALVDGWRDLPACGGGVDERGLWDIVNYFRTFEAR